MNGHPIEFGLIKSSEGIPSGNTDAVITDYLPLGGANNEFILGLGTLFLNYLKISKVHKLKQQTSTF